MVSEWEQEFLKRMDIPLPTLCIEERHRRRLAHRNERSIYKDTSDLSGKSIISLYSEDKPFKVYAQDEWWGDAWDPRDYGRDYDFSRGFFEQFAELRKSCPRLSLMNVRAENSEYCNITNSNKNCYLVFGGDYCEECTYSIFSMHCTNSSDCYWVNKSTLTYDSIDCNNCYNVKYSQNTHNSRDSAFLFECRNCSNCFGCVGLRNKEYYIFNKKYSKEEYEKKMREFRLDTWSGVQHMKKEFAKFKLQFPHRFANIVNSEHSTGDQIVNAKNCVNCFDIEGPAEDCKDIFFGGYEAKDMVSSDHVGFKAELYYEMLGSIEGYNCAFCSFSWNSQNTFYCDMVVNSKNLFGCTSMHNAEYCILNKQYTKDAYEDLRARIVAQMKETGEWGEFFPIEDSLWAYNETVAQDVFPLSKKEVLERGWQWKDEEVRDTQSRPEIPDSIHDVTDEILQKTLVCEASGRPYRIVPQEMKLYRQLGIPIPRFAPETRNKMRIQMRNPRFIWDRECAKCSAEIATSYAPDRPEIVYCEKCYLESLN